MRSRITLFYRFSMIQLDFVDVAPSIVTCSLLRCLGLLCKYLLHMCVNYIYTVYSNSRCCRAKRQSLWMPHEHELPQVWTTLHGCCHLKAPAMNVGRWELSRGHPISNQFPNPLNVACCNFPCLSLGVFGLIRNETRFTSGPLARWLGHLSCAWVATAIILSTFLRFNLYTHPVFC